MENIVTFETGLLVGGLLIMLVYTFINVLLINRKNARNEEAIANLIRSLGEERDERFKSENDAHLNAWSNLNEAENRLQRSLDSLSREFEVRMQEFQKNFGDSEKQFDKELEVFDIMMADLKRDIRDIRMIVESIANRSESQMLNS